MKRWIELLLLMYEELMFSNDMPLNGSLCSEICVDLCFLEVYMIQR
jgi:hypothetical protein